MNHMSNADKARGVLERYDGECRRVDDVDVDSLMAAGVSAEWAENVADDVDEFNRGVDNLNKGLRILVDAQGGSDAALDEAWGQAERYLPTLEGLLLCGGVTVSDAIDFYNDQTGGDEAVETLQVIYRQIDTADEYGRELMG